MSTRHIKRAAVVRGADWDITPAVPRTIETLAKMGYEVDFLGWDRQGQLLPDERIEGFHVYRLQHRVPSASVWYFLGWPVWWTWLLHRLARGRYQLVHVMNLESVVPVVLAKSWCRCKVVYDIRDPWGLALSGYRFPVPQGFRCLDQVVSRFVDGILLSQGDIGACAGYFGRHTTRKVPAVQVLNVPQADRGIGFRVAGGHPIRINLSGHISSKRNLNVLLAAVRGRTDVVLDIVGNTPEDPVFEAQIKILPNVVLHGRVPHAEAMALMDQADVVSILYDTGMQIMLISSANKMFEAMMMGKPYLASVGTFPAQVAERFGLGWALPYNNVEALSQWLDRVVKAPQLLAETGQRGRRAYEQLFTWPRQQENMLQLYRHVLGQTTLTPPREVCGWSQFLGSHSDMGANGFAPSPAESWG